MTRSVREAAFSMPRMGLSAAGSISCVAYFAALALAGCASQGVTIPREVRVQVPVPCIAPADVPPRPELLSDGDMLMLDSYRATWALWGDRLERQAYEAKLEAITAGCSRLPATTP